MGTFRFGARCVYKRKEIPPPILGGRLFETISGYFPNPAIPLGHYTSWSTDSAGNNKVCDVTATADASWWKHFRANLFRGSPAGSVSSRRRTHEQMTQWTMIRYQNVFWCNIVPWLSSLGSRSHQNQPMRLDLMVFWPWMQNSTKR